MDKYAIRHLMRQKRAKLSLKARIAASKKAARLLIASDIFLKSIHIACYLAKGAEMDTYPIIEEIWQINKHCYLPIVHATQFGQMYFVKYLEKNKLITNRFGIKEPTLHKKDVIETKNLDLVILPLIAFDLDGHRIGSGGGYYDNAFQFLTRTPSLRKPFLCGLAYTFQQVSTITPREEDINLHAVVTESNMIYF